MLDIKWVGGSEQDRARVAEQHQNYLEANASFDWERLQGIYSGADYATYFNLNGHTYDGRAQWTELWKYYKPRLETGYWTPYELKGVMSGDLATVWCFRKTRSKWVGSDPSQDPSRQTGDEHVTRSTMVFEKKDGDWRVIHVHFSDSKVGQPRPGDI
jgi:ketosteroid isomerase-like protein